MEKKSRFNTFWQIILALVVLIGDRVIKGYILNNCRVGEIFGEIPFVCDFLYVKNTGAAFSLMSNNTALLSIISVIFVIGVVIYKLAVKPQGAMLNLAITLMFAGALGNGIDRIAYKFVVDFIAIKWFDFPVFNIADIAIVLGAVAAIVHALFFDKSKENKNE